MSSVLDPGFKTVSWCNDSCLSLFRGWEMQEASCPLHRQGTRANSWALQQRDWSFVTNGTSCLRAVLPSRCRRTSSIFLVCWIGRLTVQISRKPFRWDQVPLIAYYYSSSFSVSHDMLGPATWQLAGKVFVASSDPFEECGTAAS